MGHLLQHIRLFQRPLAYQYCFGNEQVKWAFVILLGSNIRYRAVKKAHKNLESILNCLSIFAYSYVSACVCLLHLLNTSLIWIGIQTLQTGLHCKKSLSIYYTSDDELLLLLFVIYTLYLPVHISYLCKPMFLLIQFDVIVHMFVTLCIRFAKILRYLTF